MFAAGRALQANHPKLGLVVTGGHLEPPDDLVLEAPAAPNRMGEALWLPGKRVGTTATHGTGCAFSSALLSALVQGKPPRRAAQAAKHFVAEALRQAVPLGRGHGPMNLLWPLQAAPWEPSATDSVDSR